MTTRVTDPLFRFILLHNSRLDFENSFSSIQWSLNLLIIVKQPVIRYNCGNQSKHNLMFELNEF